MCQQNGGERRDKSKASLLPQKMREKRESEREIASMTVLNSDKTGTLTTAKMSIL